MDIYNGNRTQVESYRQITGVTTPLLLQGRNGDYAGARLEDIIVVDQKGVVRYATNMLGVDVDYIRINGMVDALLNQSPVVSLSLRSLYFGAKLEVGQSKSTTLKISNTGESALEITGITAPEGITMDPPALSVGINKTESVKITFSPTQSGPFSGNFAIDHTDQYVGPIEIPIVDLAIEPGQIPITPADSRTDFDGSGKIDFPDFLSFAQAFGTTSTTHDLDGSNKVDFADFLIFVSNFGKTID